MPLRRKWLAAVHLAAALSGIPLRASRDWRSPRAHSHCDVPGGGDDMEITVGHQGCRREETGAPSGTRGSSAVGRQRPTRSTLGHSVSRAVRAMSGLGDLVSRRLRRPQHCADRTPVARRDRHRRVGQPVRGGRRARTRAVLRPARLDAVGRREERRAGRAHNAAPNTRRVAPSAQPSFTICPSPVGGTGQPAERRGRRPRLPPYPGG